MTNFEKMMKDDTELIKYAVAGKITLKNGKPVPCREIACNECDYDNRDCEAKMREWLDAEYKESVKLNEKERLFCEMIEDGYLARDSNNALWWYEKTPFKNKVAWESKDKHYSLNLDPVIVLLFKDNLHFDFIKWEDKEPWSVKELLEMQNRTADE